MPPWTPRRRPAISPPCGSASRADAGHGARLRGCARRRSRRPTAIGISWRSASRTHSCRTTNAAPTAAGTVRGMHFQAPPRAQAKLVRVLSGSILDMVVDLRRSSASYGRHLADRPGCRGGPPALHPARVRARLSARSSPAPSSPTRFRRPTRPNSTAASPGTTPTSPCHGRSARGRRCCRSGTGGRRDCATWRPASIKGARRERARAAEGRGPNEGHRAGGRQRHAALSRDTRRVEAAPPRLRQAAGLLPALGADAGRRARRAADLHAARPAAVPAPARRRLAVGHPDRLRGAGPAARHRPRPGARGGIPRRRPFGADPRRQRLPRQRPRPAPGGGPPDGRGRRGVRLPRVRPGALRRGGVRPRRPRPWPWRRSRARRAPTGR